MPAGGTLAGEPPEARRVAAAVLFTDLSEVLAAEGREEKAGGRAATKSPENLFYFFSFRLCMLLMILAFL